MRLLGEISEDEVVAVFLGGELDSSRYGDKLRALVARNGLDLAVLRHPDVTDADENSYRRQLLDEHRSFAARGGLFLGFPRDVAWFRAALDRDEVLDILFINWSWWLDLSGGSRRPRDAADRIRRGEVSGVSVDEHEPLAVTLRAARRPQLIAVTTPAKTPLVLVEGHYRLTACALFPEYLPAELEIVLGVAADMPEWCQF